MDNVPKISDLLRPFLEYVSDGQEYQVGKVITGLAEKLNLSKTEKEELQPSGREPKFENRVRWAKLHLKGAKLLEEREGLRFAITNRGFDVIKSKKIIDYKFLRTFPEYVEYRERKRVVEESSMKVPSVFTETLLNNILKRFVENEGRVYEIEKRINKVRPDGWAPEGIGDLVGPVYVEIKRSLDNKNIHMFLTKLQNNATQLKASSVLLATIDYLGKETEEIIRSQWKRLAPEINFAVWTYSRIDDVLNDFPDETASLLEIPELQGYLRRTRINQVIDGTVSLDDTEIEQINQEHIDDLHNIYRVGKIVLFLGAGVSSAAGIPSWNSLITKLRFIMIESILEQKGIVDATRDEKDEIFRKLEDLQGEDPLLSALYLENSLPNTFIEDLSGALYDSVTNTTELLDTIANFCAPRRTIAAPVKAVVTYNFDDLLEEALTNNNVRFRSIFTTEDRENLDELPIYHVHGFIPRNSEQYDAQGVPIVFSEEGYHTLYRDPYNWANLKQLVLLDGNTCVMIGLSMRDPNLRRLLRVTAESNARHYVCLRREKISDFIQNLSTRREIAQAFLESHYRVLEHSLEELGVNVIWYKDHAEIIDILKNIESGQISDDS